MLRPVGKQATDPLVHLPPDAAVVKIEESAMQCFAKTFNKVLGEVKHESFHLAIFLNSAARSPTIGNQLSLT